MNHFKQYELSLYTFNAALSTLNIFCILNKKKMIEPTFSNLSLICLAIDQNFPGIPFTSSHVRSLLSRHYVLRLSSIKWLKQLKSIPFPNPNKHQMSCRKTIGIVNITFHKKSNTSIFIVHILYVLGWVGYEMVNAHGRCQRKLVKQNCKLSNQQNLPSNKCLSGQPFSVCHGDYSAQSA